MVSGTSHIRLIFSEFRGEKVGGQSSIDRGLKSSKPLIIFTRPIFIIEGQKVGTFSATMGLLS